MNDEDCLVTLEDLVRTSNYSPTQKQLMLRYLEKTKPVPPKYRYCETCGCQLAYYLGDLEYHKAGCQEIPF